jgi:hypothetical protein
MRAHRSIFTAGPWQPEWGDPNQPRQVSDSPVARKLLRREDCGGALVVLADSRFALTGDTYAAGTARALMRHARSRSRCTSGKERAWLLLVTDELNSRSHKRRLGSTGGRSRRSLATPSSPVPH